MRNFNHLIFEEKGGIAWIRMNRPDELNALNLGMTRELNEAAVYCTNEKSIRALVLTGMGKAFSAGGDIKDMAKALKETGRSDLFLRDLAIKLHTFVAEIARMPKPVLAGVNGIAAGAGFSLSLACDMTIAVEEARFVMAYTNIGLVPDGGATYFLSRLVGPKKAMELIHLNEPLGAEEALRLGIVNRIATREAFEKTVAEVAQKLAEGPTTTFGRAKDLVRRGLVDSLESHLEDERQSIAISSLQGEFREGLTALIEKRKPNFRGVT